MLVNSERAKPYTLNPKGTGGRAGPCAAGQALGQVDEEHVGEERKGDAEGCDGARRVWEQPGQDGHGAPTPRLRTLQGREDRGVRISDSGLSWIWI